ncbi:hypothetical protein BUALT_Bualt05G0047700 [Buddleja alternifolia]|uniref:Uncharacterized protein n=1 Tax=Buddleja alternifolia TaxID=168488 RepID=A0AAV6XPK4_9LAMI|nr:hypothetical protein BUALT_Bualt05G0047700 [Buddleja alternifolia]
MSSSEPEILISMIGPSSSIPELIKSIRHSFRDCEFDEVQKILTDRDKNTKMEIENLVRDRDRITKEVRLLERSHGLAELENSKLEQKCEELEEKITRLIEEERVSSHREKRAKERSDKVCDENAKMASEKNKIIFELNDKINELNNKNLESERLLGFLNEKFRCLDAKAAKMEKVIKDLQHEKLNASRTMDELRVAKLESDKAAELNKKRFEDLAPRIVKVEEALANILNVKVENVAKIVDDLDNAAAEEEGGNVNFVESKGEKDILGNGDAEENAVVKSPGVRSTCNSSENVPKKGGRNDDAANSVETSPGAQSGSDPPQVENNATDQENGSKGLQGSGIIHNIL